MKRMAIFCGLMVFMSICWSVQAQPMGINLGLITANQESFAIKKEFSAPLQKDPLENVVHFSPSCTGIYLGSPSLVRLENGDILASMDMFGPNAPNSPKTGSDNHGLIFRSSDDGKTWRFVTEIVGTFWANLFVHQGVVYHLGTSEGNGSIVIRKSEDNGETWTDPKDENSGLLFPAGAGDEGPNYHCAPMPVVLHEGRLYRAFENCTPRSWPAGFRSFVISADADADLLKASSWRRSNQLVYDQETDPPEFAKNAEHLPGGRAAGWLEGNVMVGPDGNLYNVLRVNSLPVVDRAAVVRIWDEGRKVTFDPESGFIPFPGGMTKFTIRKDPKTGLYWTIANGNTNPKNPTQRNVLSLYSFRDFDDIKHQAILLQDLEDYDKIGNESKVGFQYIDFQFDGDDIIYLSRTAYHGANNYHDANYMTFHRIENFRERFPH